MPVSDPQPLVHVFVPSYNTRSTIGEAVRSLLGQTYRNMRVVVLDNASTDGTAAAALEAARGDSRVEVSVNPVNVGGPANYAEAIARCGGDYTAIIGSDDVCEPALIEREVSYLEANPGAGAVFTEALEIDESGKIVGRRVTPGRLVPKPSYSLKDILRAVLTSGNFLICPTLMARTGVLRREIHPLDPKPYKTSTDLAIWLKILERYDIGIIREPLLRYRLSRHSFSYNYIRMRTARHDMFLVLDDYVRKYAGKVLGPADLRNYRLLQAKDDLNVAINYLTLGESSKARALILGGPLQAGTLAEAWRAPWFYKFCVIAIAAILLSVLPLGAVGRRLLYKVRHA